MWWFSDTEGLRALTSTVSHVLVFKEERNSQEWQRIKSNIPWELLSWASLQEDRTHLPDPAQPHPDTSSTGKYHPCLERFKSTTRQRAGWSAAASLWYRKSHWKSYRRQFLVFKTQTDISCLNSMLWAEAEPGDLMESLPTLMILWFYILGKGKG